MFKRLAPLAILMLLLAACGPAGPEPVSVEIDLMEFTYTPGEIVAAPGAPVTVKLVNMGVLEHNFLVMEEGYSAEAPFSEEDQTHVYFESGTIQPSESNSVSFTAPSEPGTYQIVCNVSGHLEGGMVGTLTVRE